MTIAIKGSRNGLSILIPSEGDWEAFLTQLEEKFSEKEGFWSGPAVLEVGDRHLDETALQKALDLLGGKLGPIMLQADHAETKAVGSKLGLKAPQEAESRPIGALYLRQTVRSGQSIRHDGTVVICGDVNAGAEVIAGGDVVVFGTLRGLAHAGAQGDEKAQVVAVNLRPTQIRIASKIARSPDHGAPPLSKTPEVASIIGEEINISPLM